MPIKYEQQIIDHLAQFDATSFIYKCDPFSNQNLTFEQAYKAAQMSKGNSCRACIELAYCYYQGRGSPKDLWNTYNSY